MEVCFAGSAQAALPQYEIALGEGLQQQARQSDKETSSLPSLPDVGRALNQQFGQTDAKDVGKAINENTPGKQISFKVACMLLLHLNTACTPEHCLQYLEGSSVTMS